MLSVLLCTIAARGQETPAVDADGLTPQERSALEAKRAPAIRGMDVNERVGLYLPMETVFTDSHGGEVTLGKYFTKNEHRPAVIVMGYYRCPIVCGAIREKLMTSLSKTGFTPGQHYNVLVFSIDSSETPEAAEARRQDDMGYFLRELSPQEDGGIRYHVGSASQSRQLADALGFEYRPVNGEFSHPVAVFLATPDGRISRYLYGFSQEPRALKLALMEASEGKLVKTIGDRLMAFCYMFDPDSGTYTMRAFRVMQVAGVTTVLAIGALLGVLFMGERLRKRAMKEQTVSTLSAGGADRQTGMTA